MWNFRKSKMTCGICRRVHQDTGLRPSCRGIKFVETCPVGDVPKLMKDNLIFRNFFRLIQYGLIQADGGYDYSAISFFYGVYQVKQEDQPVFFERCLLILSVLEEVRQTERKK